MRTTELQLWTDDDAAPVFVVVPDVAASIAVLEERARSYEIAAKSANTWRAYRSDLRHFGAWCMAHGLVAMPAAPETLRLYLVDHAEHLAISTLRRRLAAISQAHQAAGQSNPTKAPEVTYAWEGIRRTHARAPRSKEAAITDTLAVMLAPLERGPETSLIDLRDRAILLIGFAAALRRSELANLDATSVIETGEGLRIIVTRSKTDQESAGAIVGVTYGANPPTCPVRAWRAWRERAGIIDGPAFRSLRNGYVTNEPLSGGGVARMVKRRAKAVGFDPDLFGGHSLRRGFATTATRAGVSEHRIMKQGRWTTSQAMRGYIQEGELFIDNPSAKLGL